MAAGHYNEDKMASVPPQKPKKHSKLMNFVALRA
jgi:hypothetical protein